MLVFICTGTSIPGFSFYWTLPLALPEILAIFRPRDAGIHCEQRPIWVNQNSPDWGLDVTKHRSNFNCGGKKIFLWPSRGKHGLLQRLPHLWQGAADAPQFADLALLRCHLREDFTRINH
jgi:hypothetical protein